MLGTIFRQLRKQRGKSIIEVSQNIISPSSVQRWENNHGEMSIDKVIQLLNKIDIQPDEFLAKAKLLDLDMAEDNIRKAYQINDLSKLKEIAESLLATHYLKPNDTKRFIHAAIACNYYLDLSDENLFNKESENVTKLRTMLVSIENWNQNEVSIFGNTILLLSAYDIQKIATSLYNYLTFQDNTHTFFVMSINTLINAVVALLKAKTPQLAYDLLTKIKYINLSERNSNEIIKIHFLDAFFSYLKTDDKYTMTAFFHNLIFLGMEEKVRDFKLGLCQLEKLYFSN